MFCLFWYERMRGEEKPVAEGHDVDEGERAVAIPIQEVFSAP